MRRKPRTLYEIYAEDFRPEDFDWLEVQHACMACGAVITKEGQRCNCKSKETPMPQPNWQHTVNQIQGAIDVIRPVASDPASSPEDQTESQRVLVVLEAYLQHLFERHKVKPTPADPFHGKRP